MELGKNVLIVDPMEAPAAINRVSATEDEVVASSTK
jgi:hypothetical protein